MSAICSIEAKNISKCFKGVPLFKDIGFTIKNSCSLAVIGPNGSGKSTLLEIIAGLKAPSTGSLHYEINSQQLDKKNIPGVIGFSSPLVNPYNELTGYENLKFTSKEINLVNIEKHIKEFNLLEHMDKKVKHYSSGMRQRLKFLLALINNPPIIILDEPGSNLDKAGKNAVLSNLELLKKEKIIIIATNEEDEANFCEEKVRLG